MLQGPNALAYSQFTISPTRWIHRTGKLLARVPRGHAGEKGHSPFAPRMTHNEGPTPNVSFRCAEPIAFLPFDVQPSAFSVHPAIIPPIEGILPVDELTF